MRAADIKYYFTTEAGDIYKCICDSKPRKRRKGSGYCNLHSHINAKHPNWTTEVLTDQSNSKNMFRGLNG